MAVNITSSNVESEIKQSSLPVVIDFFASWCGPCQQVGPIFEELSKELCDKYKFAKVNIDEERDLAIQHNVSSVPTFIFIKNGKVVGREQGYMDKETLKSKIESRLG
jgi:thioredoxin 1